MLVLAYYLSFSALFAAHFCCRRTELSGHRKKLSVISIHIFSFRTSLKPAFLTAPMQVEYAYFFSMARPQRIKKIPTAKNQKPEGRSVTTITVTPSPMITIPIFLQFLHKKSAPYDADLDKCRRPKAENGHFIVISIIRRRRKSVTVV